MKQTADRRPENSSLINFVPIKNISYLYDFSCYRNPRKDTITTSASICVALINRHVFSTYQNSS